MGPGPPGPPGPTGPHGMPGAQGGGGAADATPAANPADEPMSAAAIMADPRAALREFLMNIFIRSVLSSFGSWSTEAAGAGGMAAALGHRTAAVGAEQRWRSPRRRVALEPPFLRTGLQRSSDGAAGSVMARS